MGGLKQLFQGYDIEKKNRLEVSQFLQNVTNRVYDTPMGAWELVLILHCVAGCLSVENTGSQNKYSTHVRASFNVTIFQIKLLGKMY